MSPPTAILAAIALPLLGVPLIALLGSRPNVREAVTLTTGGILFLVVLSLAAEVFAGARPEIHLIEILPGLALGFKIEPLGMLFALIASGLWIITSIYSIGYMRGHHEEQQTRFYVFFAVAIAAVVGAAFSRNMLPLFIF